MELTHELRENAGLQWVLERLSPLSPFGKQAARTPRWYGPGEEAALEEELDNVALAMELRGVPKAQRRDTARALMAKMGLGGFERSYPRELSGGMKKRAAIARVLALDPAILMMDEPFAPLDALTRQRLQDEILTTWEATGCTILYVTHDLTEAITLADRVLLMSTRPGKVVREYVIDLPRPRRVMDVKFTPHFVELERAIWQDLETQLREGGGL